MEGIWPLIIFAVIAMLFGGGNKKRPRQTPPFASSDDAPPSPAEQGLMGELNRALQELKRAEQEAMARRTAQAGAPAPASEPRASRHREVRREPPRVVRGQQPASERTVRGSELVKRKVHHPKPARPPVRVAPRPVEFDPDQAFEDATVISLEGLDYDSDAERLVEARARAAERRGREDSDSIEELSAAQLARRADRGPAQAIGGIAEHQAWHARVAADVPIPAPQMRPNPLARFATGRVRDALVLGEILGKPLSQR